MLLAELKPLVFPFKRDVASLNHLYTVSRRLVIIRFAEQFCLIMETFFFFSFFFFQFIFFFFFSPCVKARHAFGYFCLLAIYLLIYFWLDQRYLKRETKSVSANNERVAGRSNIPPTDVQIQCCFTSTDTISIIRVGEPRTSTSSFTHLLISVSRSPLCSSSVLLYVHRVHKDC